MGASPMMKVGFHTIRKVMGGREIFKPQEFFSLSNSLYEFFLGHSMKFWGGIFSFNFPYSANNFSPTQAFLGQLEGRDEIRVPLKTPAWEAIRSLNLWYFKLKSF